MKDEKEKIEVETDEDEVACAICGEKHKRSVVHGFVAKGQKKYICEECADTVHGLV